MTARALEPALGRILTLAEQLDAPCVLVDFAPGASATERLEVMDGLDGPRAADVVRSVARCLAVQAAGLDAEPDEETANPRVFYVLSAGERAARIYGLTLDAFIDAVISVAILDAPRRLAARRAQAQADGWYEPPVLRA